MFRMIKQFHIILLFFLMNLFSFAVCKGYKACQVNNILNETNRCKQENAICVQKEPEGSLAECRCDTNFVFNENYTDNKDYCLPRPEETTPQPEIKEPNINNNQSREVLAGIFIPLVGICLLLPAVFLVKKYNVCSWIREHIIPRRNLPQYEDVMIGQDDTDDDPPLL